MKKPFFISKLTKATLLKISDRTQIEVWLDKNEFIFDLKLDKKGLSTLPWIKKITARKNPASRYVKKQLLLFKKNGKADIANSKNPIRWVASGIILVVKIANGKRYFVLNKRPLHSVYGGYWDANAGYSSSIKEMIHPDKISFREFKEELKIFINNKRINIDNLKPNYVHLKNSVKCVVHYLGKKYVTDNLNLFIDTSTGTIDFRQIIEIRVKSLKNIMFEDNETSFISPTKENILNRPISVFSVDQLKKIRITPSVNSTLKGYL